MDGILKDTLLQLNQFLITNNINAIGYCDKKKIKFLLEEIESDSNSIRTKVVKNIILRQNQITLYQIKRISEFLLRRSIRFVFVKGITTAGLVYDDICLRNFGDIDVYVEEKGIRSLLEFLSKEGYKNVYTDHLVDSKLYNEYRHAATHLTPFYKHIFDERTGIYHDICVEIHLFPFFVNSQYRMLQSESKYNLFFQSTCLKRVFGIEIPTLVPTLNLIYLMDHFSKHICSSFEANIYEEGFEKNNIVEVYLLKLIEAKVFYEKNKNYISDKDLILYCSMFNVSSQVALAMKYINVVWDGTFANLLLDNIINSNSYCYLAENKMCEKFTNMDLCDIVNNRKDALRDIADYVYGINGDDCIGKNIYLNVDDDVGCPFSVDNNFPNNPNGYNLMLGNEIDGVNLSLYGNIKIDKQNIVINAEITDQLIREGYTGCVIVHVCNFNKRCHNQCYVGIKLSYYISGDCIKNDICYLNNDNTYDPCAIEYTFEKTAENSYGFKFILNPQQFGIVIKSGHHFYFDVELRKTYNNSLMNCSSIACLRDSYSPKYGCKVDIF